MNYILGLMIGGAAGYVYHKLAGCPTGTCPITSNPKISVIYGAVMGLLTALWI